MSTVSFSFWGAQIGLFGAWGSTLNTKQSRLPRSGLPFKIRIRVEYVSFSSSAQPTAWVASVIGT